MRADSGFYTYAVVAVYRKTKVRFSITIRQRASRRNLIEAIPEEDWTPIPYWMDGAASLCIFPSVGPGGNSSVAPWHFLPDGGNQPADPPSGHLNVSANSRQPSPRRTLLAHRLSN